MILCASISKVGNSERDMTKDFDFLKVPHSSLKKIR